jgi:ketosteroid isomerase-like protein
MARILIVAFLIISISSCSLFDKKKPATSEIDEKIKLMDADRAFSKLSEEKGMKHAFLEYIDSNGVLLRDDRYPLLGADAVDYLIQQNDSSFTMAWEPRGGAVAHSGELGYTYGIYALRPSSQDTTIYGTYVSIWKKQKDGNWKFILDSGNEGLGEPVQEGAPEGQ